MVILNRDQAINILFATIHMYLNKNDNVSEHTEQLIDEAKEYVLRNLR